MARRKLKTPWRREMWFAMAFLIDSEGKKGKHIDTLIDYQSQDELWDWVKNDFHKHVFIEIYRHSVAAFTGKAKTELICTFRTDTNEREDMV